MNSFPASDIFKIVEVSKPFPLNLKFVLRENQPTFDFSRRIIYSILVDEKVVYIGYSFDDKRKDIRFSRWTKQLETHLFRGYLVGLNNKAFLEFESTLKPKLSNHFANTIKARSTGVMTSSNRISCLVKYWGEIEKIGPKNDAFLSRISFQIKDSGKLTTRKEFQYSVKELIKKYKP